MSKMAASSPHLCLRWNNYQSNLTSVFDQLLQNETFVDVTLAADGHAIKAHRMVLSACSPYFQALFFDNPCQHPIVILKDTRWSELKAIVEYMYRGEISVAQEELTSLLRVAETLRIRGLSELNGDRHAAAAAGIGDDQRSETSAGGAVTPVAGILHAGSASANAATAAAGRRAESPTSSWPLQAQPWSHGDETPTPSPSPAPQRANKRRRVSAADVNSTPGPASPEGSTPGPVMEDAASLDGPLPLTHHQSPASSTAASTPAMPTAAAAAALAAALTQSATANQQQQSSDDLDIKPGIAELIREEERARMLEGTHPWLTASPSVLSESLVQWRSKAPSWTKEQLQEAINSIVTQKMRFTQASSHYNIPKGTLYDNILGKSKRMLVLDEVGLDASEEDAVLDFCCETSVMPYNRRTNKSLESILSFVEKLKHSKGQSNFRLSLGTILAFRWWWAFCKKHNIVSLFYSKNKSGKNGAKNNNSNHHHNNNNNESSSLLLPTKSANNNLSPPPGDDLPENLSSSKFDDDDSSGGGSGGVGGGGHGDEGVADADGAQLANLTAPFYRSLNNNNIHLSQALQLSHAFLIRQGHHHNLRSRTHSVDQDEDSDLEPENLSVHKD